MVLARRFLQVVFAAGMVVGTLVASNGGEDKGPAESGTLRDGFETAQPIWQREYSDTTVKLLAQDRSERAAHGGRLSEHFQFDAGLGSQFFVSYAVPRIPISEELSVGLHVRSTRAGVQIFGRVVLPADVDPDTKAPSYVLVPGTIFDQIDRWQRIELVQMLPAIERQARVLRASTRRPVRLDGAYLEKVVVNLMGGAGESEVFLDDLEITPVPKDSLAGPSKPESSGKPAAVPRTADSGLNDGSLAAGRVRLGRNILEKLGSDRRFQAWIPTAIDAPGASVVKLRQAGLDVIIDDLNSDPERLKSAVDRGFLLMPRLSGATDPAGPDRLLKQISSYPQRSSVAFWNIADHLGRHRDQKTREVELERVRASLAAVRELDDVSHLLTATVDGELPAYARTPTGLDMVGIQPRFWASSQSFPETFQYLLQRKRLTVRSNVGGLFWAWIPASTPPEVVRNIWGEDTPPAWGTPPVQPEQLRLMTYLALSAGYRGIAYVGDADLTRPAGEALLLEMHFLNLEIDLCEEIIAQSVEVKSSLLPMFPPPAPDLPSNATQQQTKRQKSTPEVPPIPGMGAGTIVMGERKGSLLLAGNFADGAQFQPSQLAVAQVMITPVLPEGAQGFEISPGEVKVLEPKRVPGGIQFILDEFDTTRLILCTTDMGLYERIRTTVDRVRPRAVPLAIRQAELQLAAVKETHARLEADGHEILADADLKKRRKAGIETKPPDAKDLLDKAEANIKAARDAWEREDYATAWAEARRAGRPLRHLMQNHWQQAYTALTKAADSINPKRPSPSPRSGKVPPTPSLLVTPVSCPPFISFFTLPELYIWTDWIKGRPGYRFGRNLVPSGDFDDPDAIIDADWVNLSYQLEGVASKIQNVPRSEANGQTGIPKKKSSDELSPDNGPSNYVVKMVVKSESPGGIDSLVPFLDFPAAAIRSPSIHVEANNLIRISVLVRRPFPSPPGMGGIIVRDSIGGEQFQFRTSGAIPAFSRVVLFRKAPATGTFNVTLGLAGYGEAYFDDFRVEVIEQAPGRDRGSIEPEIAQGRRRSRTSGSPALPDPTPPAAASRPVDSPR
jgi:hypothetical protein